mmetsp:Transcript_45375/g.104125  ORF Transcript_45375/g.104125 Transcript_45375/m.104125 type:complete len:300 (+) Transcript_45375:532-1431(+)
MRSRTAPTSGSGRRSCARSKSSLSRRFTTRSLLHRAASTHMLIASSTPSPVSAHVRTIGAYFSIGSCVRTFSSNAANSWSASKSHLFATSTQLFLCITARFTMRLSCIVSVSRASKTNIVTCALFTICFARITAIRSTSSRCFPPPLSFRMPAVSATSIRSPPHSKLEVTASRVVPGFSCTTCLSSFRMRFRIDDLPTLGLPITASFISSSSASGTPRFSSASSRARASFSSMSCGPKSTTSSTSKPSYSSSSSSQPSASPLGAAMRRAASSSSLRGGGVGLDRSALTTRSRRSPVQWP